MASSDGTGSALALALARQAQAPLRSRAQRFARRVFAESGADLARRCEVREAAGRDDDAAQLLADV